MFYFFLAEKLGMTVGILLNSIGSRELSEWRIYYELINKGTKGEDSGKVQDAKLMNALQNAKAFRKAKR